MPVVDTPPPVFSRAVWGGGFHTRPQEGKGEEALDPWTEIVQ